MKDELIKDSKLPNRVKNCLESLNFKMLSELNGVRSEYLLKQRNLGIVSIKLLNEYLSDFGYSINVSKKKRPAHAYKFLIQTLQGNCKMCGEPATTLMADCVQETSDEVNVKFCWICYPCKNEFTEYTTGGAVVFKSKLKN